MEINKKFFIKCGIVLFVIILLFSITYYVSPGYRGTLVTLGHVHKTSFTSGIGVKWPFISTMVKTDVRTQVVEEEP